MERFVSCNCWAVISYTATQATRVLDLQPASASLIGPLLACHMAVMSFNAFLYRGHFSVSFHAGYDFKIC